MDVSAKQLVSLFKESINFPQPNTLDGSVESIRNYYKMIRQFATMANIYQDLIPEKYDDSYTVFLKLYVESSFWGNWATPSVKITNSKNQVIEYFEDGVRGYRYLNLSSVLTNGANLLKFDGRRVK